jgi:hypothetical protein
MERPNVPGVTFGVLVTGLDGASQVLCGESNLPPYTLDLAAMDLPRWPELSNTDIRSPIVLVHSKIHGHADFGGVRFASSVFLDAATFTGEVNFSNASFRADLSFASATFCESVDLSGSDVLGKCLGSGAHFLGPLTVTARRFADEVILSQAEFAARASFAKTQFQGHTSFLDARFSDPALFGSCSFDDVATFEAAKFHDGVAFREAKFRQEASFDRAVFSGAADFQSALFDSQSSFDHCDFERGADFQSAEFAKQASFEDAEFQDTSSFESAQFREVGHFSRANFLAKSPSFLGVDQKTTLIFRETTFATPTGTSEELEHYTALKQLAESQGHYSQALDFHAKELEARQRSKTEGSSRRLVTLLYGLLSDYGRSFTRPFWCLLGLTALTFLIALSNAAMNVPARCPGAETASWISELARSNRPCQAQKPSVYLSPEPDLARTLLYPSGFRAAVEMSMVGGLGVVEGGTPRERRQEAINLRLFGDPLEPGLFRAFNFIRTLLSVALIFLIGLGLRNSYRVRS